MKLIYTKICVAVLSALFLNGCETRSGGVGVISEGDCSLISSSSNYHIENIEQTGTFTYVYDLGDSPKEVCLIFTNPGGLDTDFVAINSQRINLNKPDNFDSSFPQVAVGRDKESLPEYARKRGIGLKGTPEISEFNANPPKFEAIYVTKRLSSATKMAAAEGDAENFIYNSIGDSISATLRKIISVGSVTLNIWVSDDTSAAADGFCGGPSSDKTYCVTQSMIDQFGDKLLKANADNDIYDWTVNIFGEPWGDHNFPSLIDPAAAGQIDILFYDIDADNSANGGILGLFWSKDNYKKSYYSASNERLMFYIDSVMAAAPSGECWEITDYWPSIIVSTLAHEFQHMIHFYQKQIRDRNVVGNSEIWINEMSSMVAEDLLADKLQVNGPRGVAYDDGGPGAADNKQGRLPRYNYYNYEALSGWRSGAAALVSYSLNYAFGAYLARNYGGAGLFREIARNQFSGYKAIERALEDLGYSETFGSVLQKWGVAALLSDRTDAPISYQYNIGGYFTSSLDDITYYLGSINLYNYCFGELCGPRLFKRAELSGISSHIKTSNTYIKWASRLRGFLSLKIKLPDDVKMTALIADSG